MMSIVFEKELLTSKIAKNSMWWSSLDHQIMLAHYDPTVKALQKRLFMVVLDKPIDAELRGKQNRYMHCESIKSRAF